MWTPVQQSTNQIDWFTVLSCYIGTKGISLIQFLHAIQQNEQLILTEYIVEFWMYRFCAPIVCKNAKLSLVADSIPPNTHLSEAYRAQLIFQFDINDSSICPVTPLPPILKGFPVKFLEHESQKNCIIAPQFFSLC